MTLLYEIDQISGSCGIGGSREFLDFVVGDSLLLLSILDDLFQFTLSVLLDLNASMSLDIAKLS